MEAGFLQTPSLQDRVSYFKTVTSYKCHKSRRYSHMQPQYTVVETKL